MAANYHQILVKSTQSLLPVSGPQVTLSLWTPWRDRESLQNQQSLFLAQMDYVTLLRGAFNQTCTHEAKKVRMEKESIIKGQIFKSGEAFHETLMAILE